jgi:hypothetical protein
MHATIADYDAAPDRTAGAAISEPFPAVQAGSEVLRAPSRERSGTGRTEERRFLEEKTERSRLR